MNQKQNTPNDITAPFYDIVWGPFTNTDKTEREVAFVAKLAPAGATILDLGCGTGRHLLPLARRGYHLVGIDNSRAMLKILKSKLPKKLQSVRLIFGDVAIKKALPAAQGVICYWNAFCEMALTERQAQVIFRAVARALDRGGFFLIETPNPKVMDLRAGEFHSAVRLKGLLYEECFRVRHYDRLRRVLIAEETINISRRRQVRRRLRVIIRQKIWTAGQLRHLARRAGFKRQRIWGDGFKPFSPTRSKHQIQVFYK